MKKSETVRPEEEAATYLPTSTCPHAEQELLEARLTLQIYKIIKARGLTHGLPASPRRVVLTV